MNDTIATLENWRLPPFNRSAFSNVREIIPTSKLNKIAYAKSSFNDFKNLTLKVSDLTGNSVTLEEHLKQTVT